MRTLILALALVPALALSAPPPPPGPGGAASAQARRDDQRLRHLRLARALGLADALDLDEQGALKLRATLARHDERRAPVERDVAEAVRTLRAAAAGEGVQAAQVDGAVQRLHDGRERLARLARAAWRRSGRRRVSPCESTEPSAGRHGGTGSPLRVRPSRDASPASGCGAPAGCPADARGSATRTPARTPGPRARRRGSGAGGLVFRGVTSGGGQAPALRERGPAQRSPAGTPRGSAIQGKRM